MGCISCKRQSIYDVKAKNRKINLAESQCLSSDEIEDENKTKENDMNVIDQTDNNNNANNSKRDIRKYNAIHLLRALVNKNANIYSYYDLKDVIIGTGISGVVRLGLNRYTNEEFAIKTLTIQNSVARKQLGLIHNEVDIYLQLDHPSIARLIDVFENDNKIYLVMELCRGKELYHKLLHDKKLSEEKVKTLCIQMLECLNYCHKKFICHRDLKLENWVHVDEYEHLIKLIDFGFSRFFSPKVPMTAMHGTIYYVSPEVMEGCYREKCDIWAIGVIIYMLLSGSPPFYGNEDYQILVRIKNNIYDFKASNWAGVSNQAKAFIKLLLNKDIASRPTAEEALTHEWLQNVSLDSLYLPYNFSSSHDELIYSSYNKFIYFIDKFTLLEKIIIFSAAYYCVASKEICYLFRCYDHDKDGLINFEEFSLTLKKVIDDAEQCKYDIETIFDRINILKESSISFNNFMTVLTFEQILKNEQQVGIILDYLANKENIITTSSICNVIGCSLKNISIDTLNIPIDGIPVSTVLTGLYH